jgi:REP element-mobilizing transposase RayT
VFSTKGRKPFFDAGGSEHLNAYFGGIIRDTKDKLHAVNSVTDHVHLAIGLHPGNSVSSLARVIKTNSSKWIRQTLGMDSFAWQEGYSAFSVSYSGMNKVIEYIENQQKHHQKLTFEEELIKLLEKHQIEYDPKYVFK